MIYVCKANLKTRTPPRKKIKGNFTMMTIQILDGIQMMMYGARKQIAPVMVY